MGSLHIENSPTTINKVGAHKKCVNLLLFPVIVPPFDSYFPFLEGLSLHVRSRRAFGCGFAPPTYDIFTVCCDFFLSVKALRKQLRGAFVWGAGKSADV